MMRTKITTEQFNFMLSMLRDTDAASRGADSILVAGVCSNQPNQKYVEIELLREEYKKIVFALVIALAEVGIDKDGEPNKTGFHIEKIIDALQDGKISDKTGNLQEQEIL